MAWIDSEDVFDADTMTMPIIGIASRLVRHDSGEHSHGKGQLLFAQSGTMQIILEQAISVLPPLKLAWIPPFCSHQVRLNEVVGYRSVYIDTTVFKHLPDKYRIVATTPLLQSILENIAISDWQSDWLSESRQSHWLAVLWDELAVAKTENVLLPWPQDYRLQKLSTTDLPPMLHELSTQVGACAKTITRIFQQETGMTYQAWRQQWRLLKAIELLHSQMPLLEIALGLGFANDSAFAAFFKKMTGMSTRQYGQSGIATEYPAIKPPQDTR